jgi:endonuclease-3
MDFAKLSIEDIQEEIKTCGLYKSKAQKIKATSEQICNEYNGEVPNTLEDLTTLPGVGRKTANVVLSNAFGQDAMAVDTHVFRVSHRIGLVSEQCSTPYSVEKQLVKYLPDNIIPKAHHWLILHGRYTCTARHPKCDACGLKIVCKHYLKMNSARVSN